MSTNNEFSKVLEQVKDSPKFINLIATNFLDFVNENKIDFGQEFLSSMTAKYFSQHKYQPEPKGLFSARQTITKYYQKEGVYVNVENIIISSSTSESYDLIFKNFTNPKDEILLPCPGYPLFEYLCQYSRLKPCYYNLEQAINWEINVNKLESKITGRTKCIILISPNNPTGSIINQKTLDKIVLLAEKYGLFIIFDEVFSEFRELKIFPRPMNNTNINIFLFNGISKMLALPDLKLSWIAGSGKNISNVIDKLETANDTYLNANYLTQTIFPTLMKKKSKHIEFINATLKQNKKILKQFIIQNSKCISGNICEGGIHNILTIKTNINEEKFVVNFLREKKVSVHPGYFYELSAKPNEINIVISLLAQPSRFKMALIRLKNTFII